MCCDVAAVVQQVARLVRPGLQGRAILSTVGDPLQTGVSPLRLTQVLINLVVNAGHAVASMQRTEVGRVVVRWTAVGDRARIEVEDDGPGLPAPLERGEPELLFTTKLPGAGTGLGLSVCRELVARMNGTLELRTDHGKGTLARIDLPLGV